MSRKDQENKNTGIEEDSVFKEIKEGFFTALNGLGVALFGFFTVGVLFMFLLQTLQRKQTVEKPSKQETEPLESSNKNESSNPTAENSTPKTSLEGDISSENSERNSSSNQKQVTKQSSPKTKVIDSRPIEVEGRVLSINRVHKNVNLEDETPVGKFVVIEGKIKNVSDKTGDLLWSDLHLKDNQGREYDEATTAGVQMEARKKYNAKPPSSDIPPGLSIKIAIAYDVHPSAKGLKLIWDSGALSAEKKVIDLSPRTATTPSSNKSFVSSSSQTNTAFSPDRDNPFVDASYPQPSCGDRAPTDPAEYPVSFYPVYVEYNKNNLQQAQSQFCEDALRASRETGEIAVQVGSFATRKRARQFRNFLETEFSTAEVGEPTVLKEPNS